MSKTNVITICKNGNFKESKVVQVTDADTWDTILTAAKNKLRIKKPTRIFSKNGEEFDTSKVTFVEACTQQPKMTLVFSAGENFSGEKRETPPATPVGTPGLAKPVFRVIAEHSFIEDESVKQLERVAQLPGVRYAIGMPDLHPGRGYPIGSVIACQGSVYPHLVGNDVGCGIMFVRTTLPRARAHPDRLADKLTGLENGWDGDYRRYLHLRGVEETEFDSCLGSIGGGNHFAELQKFDEIYDRKLFDEIGLDEEMCHLLVHSGSRGLGTQIFETHAADHGTEGLDAGTLAASEYLKRHDNAVKWAQCNRLVIAWRFLESIGVGIPRPRKENDGEEHAPGANDEIEYTNSVEHIQDGVVFDACHNTVLRKQFKCCGHEGEPLWLHRKGAAPADQGPIVIPGSRGHHSYLVYPNPDATHLEYGAYSLAHGAGRKWTRSKALQHGEAMGHSGPAKEGLTSTQFGSKVICANRNTLYEEMPMAYKDIDLVIKDLAEAELITVVASLVPVVTYKTRDRNDRSDR